MFKFNLLTHEAHKVFKPSPLARVEDVQQNRVEKEAKLRSIKIKELAVKKEKQLMELNYSAAHVWDELPKVDKMMWLDLAKNVAIEQAKIAETKN